MKMQYSQYVQWIIKPYSVGIVGWTHKTFASPSCLSEGEAEIQKLFNAVIDGFSKFINFVWRRVQKTYKTTWGCNLVRCDDPYLTEEGKGKKKVVHNKDVNEEEPTDLD